MHRKCKKKKKILVTLGTKASNEPTEHDTHNYERVCRLQQSVTKQIQRGYFQIALVT